MSEIFEAIGQVGDHPILRQDLAAYELAMRANDAALAAEIVKSATHVAKQIQRGQLSRPNLGPVELTVQPDTDGIH